ncbi:uncharacterized protein OCT59_013089 [Rhizophagus irregularis]|uniref:uncharacterized protein n=1 Tax=Rhizophagus irregularis TaxID=588596 RepID=UPI0033223D3A|nr:hypothetical protein OCT59_013089 [Rhizophagus irregularis]
MFSNTFTQINKPHFVVYIFEVKLSLIFRRIMSRKISRRKFGKKLLESTRQSEIINKESELQWIERRNDGI